MAERVARILGYGVVNENVIIEKAAAFGVSQGELRKALDTPARWPKRRRRSACLQAIRAALLDEARSGGIVFWGEAPLLMNEAGPFLRVRVEAPDELRSALVDQRLKLGREEALDFLRARDEQRERWVWSIHGVSWQDPSLYDAVINAGSLGFEEAAISIAEMAPAVTADRSALATLALSNRARAVQALDRAGGRLPFITRGMQRLAAAPRGLLYASLATFLLGGVIFYSALMNWVASRIVDPLLLPESYSFLSVSGVVTDTACGAGLRTMQPPDGECVKLCVRSGGGDVKYALSDGEHLYILDDARKVEPFAGRKVAVEGLLDRQANRLAVDSIRAL